MQKPLVITVEHHATKQEVLRKLKNGFGDIRAQIAPYVSSVTEDWTDSGVEVRVIALAHAITISIQVDEQLVRALKYGYRACWVFGRLIASRVKHGATLLIEPPHC